MPEPIIVERMVRQMGSRCSLHLAVQPAEQQAASTALDAALRWLREAEATLTRFDPTSELCAMNRAAGEWHAASPILWGAVTTALAAAHATDGAFDPTLLAPLAALGYDRDYRAIARREIADVASISARPQRGEDHAVGRAGLWRDVTLDAAGQRIKLPKGAQIDLGGIGKGWAADQIIDGPLGSFAHALVSIGGDLRARGGPAPTGGWAVGVEDPRQFQPDSDAEHVAVLTIAAGGIATSGAVGHWWLRDGVAQHHLIDPHTGTPARLWVRATDNDTHDTATLLASATALAPTASAAEVAAKRALLRGTDAALTAVEEAWNARTTPATTTNAATRTIPSFDDAPIALLLALGDGTLRTSANLIDYLSQIANGGKLWLLR